MIETAQEVRKYILVAIDTGRGRLDARDSVDELESLLETAGGECVGKIIQPLEKPNTKTYLGKGKMEELALAIRETGADGVIADDELSPMQIKNMSEELDVQVLDRTLLILEIFSQRAKTREGQLQVDLARLQYKLSRLSGLGVSMSRQGGAAGVHARGAGETKLELDRRYIRERIDTLKAQLQEMAVQRELQRKRRQKNEVPMVALVGYTNAGKSTLFNRFTDAGVLEENQLFATLDITTRKLELPSGREVLLADTVGFIQKLPHHLVKAFHATLEEVAYADILIHVVDSSDIKADVNMMITMEAMESLGAGDKPVITAFNKCDLPQAVAAGQAPGYMSEEVLRISALNGEDRQRLLEAIDRVLDKQVKVVEVLIPYSAGTVSSRLHESAQILEEEYRDTGVYMKVQVTEKEEGWVRNYIL